MKKLSTLFCVLLFCFSSVAQTPTYQQKLYITGKIWGFARYYHSSVSNCMVNWDSVLVHYLPSIKNAATNNDFNDLLDSMLTAAGPMALSNTPFPDTIAPELKFNRDFSWFSDPLIRSDVKTMLDTIKNNFRPHPICYVQDNYYTGAYSGWLIFPYDSLMRSNPLFTNYPDEPNRVLAFYKVWNIIRYFYPYNNALDHPWDSTLYEYAPQIADAPDATTFSTLTIKVATRLNDAHAYGLTWAGNASAYIPKIFTPMLQLKYIAGQYTVVKSYYSEVSRGDVIVSVNGLTPIQMEDSLRPYISAGNPAVFHRSMETTLLGNDYNANMTLVLKDSAGNDYTISKTANSYPYNSWYDYYPNDSLATVSWQTIQCDLGYVNMGQLQDADVPQMYDDLKNKKAIIFDLRNYPNETAWDIAQLMYPQPMEFSAITQPDVTYPGVFYWYHDVVGPNGAATPYQGKVIILMNEETQSQAEFTCMILGHMPNSIKVGSQTAGADGNVSWFRIAPDLQFGYTNLGIFYPNGDSTQRIGIIPDVPSLPTIAGVRDHRDEVLETALQIACELSVPTVENKLTQIQIAPNPATEFVTITLNNPQVKETMISISDLAGKTLLQQTAGGVSKTDFNVKSFPAGMYIVTIQTGAQKVVKKLVVKS
ncbi:T9SS type A sorting domain-containing protein [Taibaiella soli]|nr:T9SS type A sorting domain-containing protein [Taibaiella soli]